MDETSPPPATAAYSSTNTAAAVPATSAVLPVPTRTTITLPAWKESTRTEVEAVAECVTERVLVVEGVDVRVPVDV